VAAKSHPRRREKKLTSKVPDTHRDILQANGTAFIATTGPKGAPHITPTWYEWDSANEQLLVSTLAGRQKYRNLQQDPRLAVCIVGPQDPYRYIEIRGSAEVEPDEDDGLANALAKKYMNLEQLPPEMAGEGRVVIRVTPRKVVCYGAPAESG
jgi:PPOX class probable F420-dependent enzyme